MLETKKDEVTPRISDGALPFLQHPILQDGAER